MRAYAVACFIGFASLTTIGAACSFKLGEESKGEVGNLRFSYSGGKDCLFGCSLDREALQGSLVTISVTGSTDGVRHARMAKGDHIASVSEERVNCSCTKTVKNSSSSRTVEPGDKCADGEKKSCSMSVDLETSAAGDSKLEVVDGAGELVDRVDVHVRAASRIEAEVRSNGKTLKPAAGGMYEVPNGASIAVQATVYGADDEELFFTRHGVGHTYLDKKVVAPAEELFGTTDIESMRAVGMGETTVTLEAPSTSTAVRFRVMP